MNIGISSPFNPKEFENWLDKGQIIPNCNKAASSVHAYVEELLLAGHHVTIFTTYDFDGEPKIITGDLLKIYIVSRKSKFPLKNGGINAYLNRFYVGIRLANVTGTCPLSPIKRCSKKNGRTNRPIYCS